MAAKSTGRSSRMESLRRRFHAGYSIAPSSCWAWQRAVGTNGYGFIGFGGHGVITAHRASWLLHHSDPGEQMVLHKCDNRRCVNPEHLYLGSAKDNAADLMTRGTPYLEIRKHITPDVERRRIANLPHGAAHHRSAAKLTEDQVRSVRGAAGSQRAIAKRFGVSQQLVSKIKSGKYWRHVDGR